MVKCSTCDALYVGQTSRCMRNRIYEHFEKGDTHVFAHMLAHLSCSKLKFSWKVLGVERSYYKRTALEALFIKKLSSNHVLINGCVGRETLPFLH